jgi:ATP-dependent protease HslVU (ClpYQ) peptidase subunit
VTPATVTTIAYANGVLAGDSQVSSGETRLPETVRKVRRLRDGRLFGWSGKLSMMRRVLEALVNDTEIPKMGAGDGRGILVDTKGRAFSIEEGEVIRVHGKHIAYGSGSDFAYAILEDGGSAVHAVKIAKRLDKSTGGRILSVRL